MVSVLGLAIGVAVLIVVLSVMNGFERELKTRILSVTSHATLMGLDGSLDRLAARPGAGAEDARACVAAAPYIEAQALLMHGAHTRRHHHPRRAAGRRSGARSDWRERIEGGQHRGPEPMAATASSSAMRWPSALGGQDRR